MIHKEKEDLLLVPFDLSLIYKYMVSLFSFKTLNCIFDLFIIFI